MTELMDNTGFQSSRRMFRQMLPSRSMLGWKTCTVQQDLPGARGDRTSIAPCRTVQPYKKHVL